jgi:hypothetical protein
MKILRAREPRPATTGVPIVAGILLGSFCSLGGIGAVGSGSSATPGAYQPVFSVDGSLVAFLTKGSEHVPPSL